MEVDVGHTREYVHSVLFPMSTQAVSALKNLATSNVVQLVTIFVLFIYLTAEKNLILSLKESRW